MKAVLSLIFFLCVVHFNQGKEQEGPGESDQVQLAQEALHSLQERSAEPRRNLRKNSSKKCKGKKCKKQPDRKRKSRKCNRKGKKCNRKKQANQKRKCRGNKCGRKKNGNRKLPTEKPKSTCAECPKMLFDYGRDYSISRTQVNLGKRIPSFKKRIFKRAKKSATAFIQIIDALTAATNNGTTCEGKAISSNVSDILNGLRNCSSTVPQICNISSLTPNSNSSCLDILDLFGSNYKSCLFTGSGGDPIKSCTCLAGVILPARQPGVHGYTGSICLPDPFGIEESAAKKLNKACGNANKVGSWGYCQSQAKAAQPYLVGGSSQCSNITTPMISTTTASSAGRRLLLRNQFKGLFNKH